MVGGAALLVAAILYVALAPAPKPPSSPPPPAPPASASVPSASPPPPPPASESSLPVGRISLAGRPDAQGVFLSWTLSSGFRAPDGFRVVRAVTASPAFPISPSQFLSEPTARSYEWAGKDGGTYHYRVCAWNGKTGSVAGCLAYSNDVLVTAPLPGQALSAGRGYQAVSGQLSLAASVEASGVALHWTADTSATFAGYELVRSEDDPDPFWPRSGAVYETSDRSNLTYLDVGAAKGHTYYYRVCARTAAALPDCGDVLTVSVPSPY